MGFFPMKQDVDERLDDLRTASQGQSWPRRGVGLLLGIVRAASDRLSRR
jgi:hypothetical protein